ncbi:ArsR/SmtB family transcription factor [Blastococcus mobilis]|uniref:ArsR/SmtB family transcription factor n=1 Tax=Blastococcus mobilis TaxID=1938746 RepID=UPI0026E446AC|nr:metalloregulator ArsR/SmtB family transcription factor [Blastococcus mobilis]
MGDPSDVLAHLVWSGSGQHVRDVRVGGRQVVRDSASTTVDTDALRRDVAARLSARCPFFNREVDHTAGVALTSFSTERLSTRRKNVAADPLSRVFSALADPTRRDIVARLAVGDATVNELAAPYDVTVQAVSKHLKVLEDAGLVSRSREAQRRPVHLEANVFDLMTKWIERYRRQAEERYRRLDDVLRSMPDAATQHPARSPQEGTPS